MDIAKVLWSAAKLKATEAKVEVGEPTVLIVRGELRTLFGSTVKAGDFEEGVVRRLGAFKREELRSTGRCQWDFDEKGIGKIQAEVEPNKARFILPPPPEISPDVGKSTTVVGESKSIGFLSRLFGRK